MEEVNVRLTPGDVRNAIQAAARQKMSELSADFDKGSWCYVSQSEGTNGALTVRMKLNRPVEVPP